MRIANLGMYDFPGTETALDALWQHVAAELRAVGTGDVPDALTRHRPLEDIWRDPNLLLGQTCGYPLQKYLRGEVRVVATPVFDVPGCAGADHRSFIIVGADASCGLLDELRGGRLALNGYDSNTGMNLLRAALAPIAAGGRFFGSVTVTGAHAASLAAVASGAADVAAIDCVSFWYLASERPDLTAKVRILAETSPSPGLPLITHRTTGRFEIAALRTALAKAVASPDPADVRARLGLAGFAVLADDAYDIVSAYEDEAAVLGYPVLE